MTMILTTTDEVPGREHLESLGLVSARVVIGLDAQREGLLAGLGEGDLGMGTARGRLEELQRVLMTELSFGGEQLAADAVTGIRVDFEAIPTRSGASVLASALGTGVRLAPAKPQLERPSGPATLSTEFLGRLAALRHYADETIAGRVEKQSLWNRPGEWVRSVVEQGSDLVGRFKEYVRGHATPGGRRLLAELLLLDPTPESLEEIAGFAEDAANEPIRGALLRELCGHWPRVAPRLGLWIRRGGRMRDMALCVLDDGSRAVVRLADREPLESLLGVVGDTHWGESEVSAQRSWDCTCGLRGIPAGLERCPQCGLLTRGAASILERHPGQPARIAELLRWEVGLLEFLAWDPTSGRPAPAGSLTLPPRSVGRRSGSRPRLSVSLER